MAQSGDGKRVIFDTFRFFSFTFLFDSVNLPALSHNNNFASFS